MLRREGSSSGTPALTPTISNGSVSGAGQSRLQATMQAIKKIGTRLSSPRFDDGPVQPKEDEAASPGYFDTTTEEEEGKS